MIDGAARSSVGDVAEWAPPAGPGPRASARVAIAAVVLTLPVVLALGALVAGRAVLWVCVAAVLLAECAWIMSQGRRFRAGARRATQDDDARVLNIAQGLASDEKMTPPAVFVSTRAGANAAVIPSAGGGVIVVTQELLSGYGRTELEAVVAHCLVRLRAGGLGWGLASAAIGGIGAAAVPFVGTSTDALAAAMTRYPPALAAAIEKATPARGATAALWFTATGASHLPSDARAAALRDL